MTFADGGVLRLRGPLAPSAAGALCAEAHALLAAVPGSLVCVVSGPVDLGVIEALTRLRLLTRRRGADLVVRTAGTGLEELLALTGLEEPLGRCLEVDPD
jgi:hypothetical protein